MPPASPDPLLTFRPATAADVPALVALVNEAYRGEASPRAWTTEAHLLDGPRTDAAALHDLLGAPGAAILQGFDAAGARVGCVHVQARPDGLCLGLLAVAPAAQARGVGRQLLAAADDWAQRRRCRVVKITVLAARPELLAWYERRGYARTGATEPFPNGSRFGRPRQPLELVVLEKAI